MSRSYTSRDFIQLPVLDANETLLIIREIKSACEAEPNLPAPISDALEEALAKGNELDQEVIRQGTHAPANPKAQRDADHRLDVAWSAFATVLSGWTLLPPERSPNVAAAQKLHDLLFAHGTRFLNFKFRSEWVESDRRVRLLAVPATEEAVNAIGAAPFLAEIREAHLAYGLALNITEAGDAPAEPPAVAEKRHAAADALRDFITQVAAATTGKTKTLNAKQSAALLRPITSWKPSETAATAAPAPGGTTTPAPTAPAKGTTTG